MAEKLTESEQVALEYQKLQVEDLREKIADRQERRSRLKLDRERQVLDHQKSTLEREYRQSSCKHRKGGRDNRFAKGTDANYSINMNTYPDGRMVISCTRCGKEVEKPNPKMRKADPEKYAEMWAEWQKWLEYPTDNSPSGSKIFEVVTDAA